MDLQLAGRTALISGASAGIGRVTTTLLAREGVRAIVVARRVEELEKLAAEVVTDGGPEPMVIVDDLLDDGSFERVASRVLGELGGVDIIVNNLGQARLDSARITRSRSRTPPPRT